MRTFVVAAASLFFMLAPPAHAQRHQDQPPPSSDLRPTSPMLPTPSAPALSPAAIADMNHIDLSTPWTGLAVGCPFLETHFIAQETQASTWDFTAREVYEGPNNVRRRLATPMRFSVRLGGDGLWFNWDGATRPLPTPATQAEIAVWAATNDSLSSAFAANNVVGFQVESGQVRFWQTTPTLISCPSR